MFGVVCRLFFGGHVGPDVAACWHEKKHANCWNITAELRLRCLETHGSCVSTQTNYRPQRRHQTMHANDIAFGIEIETHMARNRPHADRRIPQPACRLPGCPKDGKPNATAASERQRDANPASMFRRYYAAMKDCQTSRPLLTRSTHAAHGSTNLAACTSRFLGTETPPRSPD